jgi:hypothetical protein
VCSSRRNLSAMYHIDPSEAFTQLLPAYVNMKWITRALSGILTPVCKESTVRSPKSVHHDCHNTGHTRSGWHGGGMQLHPLAPAESKPSSPAKGGQRGVPTSRSMVADDSLRHHGGSNGPGRGMRIEIRRRSRTRIIHLRPVSVSPPWRRDADYRPSYRTQFDRLLHLTEQQQTQTRSSDETIAASVLSYVSYHTLRCRTSSQS